MKRKSEIAKNKDFIEVEATSSMEYRSELVCINKNYIVKFEKYSPGIVQAYMHKGCGEYGDKYYILYIKMSYDKFKQLIWG